MFHYSVSGDNKTQVRSRVPGRGSSVRDIVVLSHGCERSISRLTSNWQPAPDLRLEKVIVRYVESMLSTLYSLCLVLSGWGDGLTFSKNNYQKTKRSFNKEGQGLWSGQVSCGAHPLWQSKWNRREKLILLIYHKQMKPHNSGTLWGRAVTCCHNTMFGRGNSIFFPLRACPP